MSDIDQQAREQWQAQWDKDGNGPWDISAEVLEHPSPEDLLELIESGFLHGFRAGATRTLAPEEIEAAAEASRKTRKEYGLCHPCRTLYPNAHLCNGIETFGTKVKCLCLSHHPEARKECETRSMKAAFRSVGLQCDE